MTKPLSCADEGTIAHKLLELCVRKGLCSPLLFVGKRVEVEADDKQHSIISPSGMERVLACPGSVPKLAGPRDNQDLSFIVTREMANAVEVVVDYIRNIKEKAGKLVKLAPEFEVWIKCLDFRGQKGHGTIDVYLESETEVHVFDLKFGKGKVVEVEDNAQLNLYQIGTLTMLNKRKRRFNHIAQPRAPHPDGPCRAEETTFKALMEFEEFVLKQVKSIDGPSPCYNPGPHCKWCPKRPCDALAKASIEAAKQDFKRFMDPEHDEPIPAKVGSLSPQQLAVAMSRIDTIKLFVSSVEEMVFARLLAGDKVIQKHYKLVEGKSNRKWRSEDQVIKEFRKLGISPDEYAPRHLVGIGDGESLVPSSKRQRFMEKLAYKPVGKAVIARVDDPRIAYKPNSANDDFADHIEED